MHSSTHFTDLVGELGTGPTVLPCIDKAPKATDCEFRFEVVERLAVVRFVPQLFGECFRRGRKLVDNSAVALVVVEINFLAIDRTIFHEFAPAAGFQVFCFAADNAGLALA